MLIQSCETFVVGNPPPHFGGRYFIFVKLVTDDGIVGYGECYVASLGPHVVASAIEDVAARHLVGEDPTRIETLWRRVYGSGYHARPDPTLVGIWSGLEIACWDIVGKAVGRPVYDLLGGRVHETLRTYTYLYPAPGDTVDVYVDADLAATRAAEAVDHGFTAVKFDPAGPYTVFDGHQPSLDDLRRSEEMVAAVRDAVGDRADLLFGTHGQFTAAGAIRLARRLETYDPLWFEEPTPPDVPDEMARVARSTTIPVATGERLCTLTEFAVVVERQAAAILQPNLGRCGGILVGKKIASMAEAHGVQIAPHLYSGPILGAANIQLATCTPNVLIVEGIGRWDGFHADILRRPVEWSDGMVVPSSEPGIGVELDEDVARDHPYVDDGTSGALHLHMRQNPAR